MSNNVEATHLEVVEDDPVMSKEQVINMLVAIGVNSCNRSYDNTHKELRQSFIEMPLSEIADVWDHLEDAVKVSVINQHSDEFKAWVTGG